MSLPVPASRFQVSDLLHRANLPSLPEAVMKLNAAIQNDAPLETLEFILQNEPALTARVLHLANSAWYYQGQRVNNIPDAIANIGFNTLHNLIIIGSVMHIFQGVDSTLVNMKTFWKQSVRLACSARVLAEHIDHPTPMRVFTSGVLAYIGKLIFYIAIPGAAQKALLISKDEGLPQYQAELQVIGHDHAEVSAELLHAWLIPPELCQPIRYLYLPEQAPADYRTDASILSVAHAMQYTFWSGLTVTDPPDSPNVAAMQLLGVGSLDLPRLANLANEQYLDTLRLLDIN